MENQKETPSKTKPKLPKPNDEIKTRCIQNSKPEEVYPSQSLSLLNSNINNVQEDEPPILLNCIVLYSIFEGE